MLLLILYHLNFLPYVTSITIYLIGVHRHSRVHSTHSASQSSECHGQSVQSRQFWYGWPVALSREQVSCACCRFWESRSQIEDWSSELGLWCAPSRHSYQGIISGAITNNSPQRHTMLSALMLLIISSQYIDKAEVELFCFALQRAKSWWGNNITDTVEHYIFIVRVSCHWLENIGFRHSNVHFKISVNISRRVKTPSMLRWR